jgi:hypothetical protein
MQQVSMPDARATQSRMRLEVASGMRVAPCAGGAAAHERSESEVRFGDSEAVTRCRPYLYGGMLVARRSIQPMEACA